MRIVHDNHFVVVVCTFALHKIAFGQRTFIDPIALSGEPARPRVVLTHLFRRQKLTQKPIFMLRTRETEVQFARHHKTYSRLIDESRALSARPNVGIVHRGRYGVGESNQIGKRQ